MPVPDPAVSEPLDRPVWSALTGAQAGLAIGDARAWRFDPEHNIFAAAADDGFESRAALAALVPVGGEVAVVEPGPTVPPPGLVVRREAAVVQMVADAVASSDGAVAIMALGDDDAAEMCALAALTRPGPFLARTHRMGRFVGVRRGGRLVAMAGERMRPVGHTEVSGVCTHPDWRGHGLAGTLMRHVAGAIAARGERPFLHAWASNSGAVALYESLGFRLRRELVMTVLARE